MPNDSKLGLIAGLAGVIAAAVLFFQDQPTQTDPQAAAPAAARPSQIFGSKPASALPSVRQPATLPVRGKPEAEAQAVSRMGE